MSGAVVVTYQNQETGEQSPTHPDDPVQLVGDDWCEAGEGTGDYEVFILYRTLDAT